MKIEGKVCENRLKNKFDINFKNNPLSVN